MSSELDAKLQRRKLDALKRGIHRVPADATTAFSVHVIGVGKAGCALLTRMLGDVTASYLADDRVRLTMLAVDVADVELAKVREVAASLKTERVQVETIALNVPSKGELQDSLTRLPQSLQLEYPLYHFNPHYQPWISADTTLPSEDGHVDRALAKALYSRTYYDGDRPLAAALRRFRKSVEATSLDSVVCVVYGLGGGTGSGVAVDLARHLSTVEFGHSVVVVGMGIAPCDGDSPEHRSSALFPVITELDCMLDETKNRGVVAAFGDLYRNPFTGGFIVIPQQPVWHATHDLAATHERVDRELSSLLLRDHGAQLWETLRFLNWVAAPSTQHSAARTPYGAQWLHLWNFIDIDGGAKSNAAQWLRQLGVRDSYTPEIVELRTANPAGQGHAGIAASIDQFFKPEAATLASPGGVPGSVQFILPRLRKTDIDLFFTAQEAYDKQQPAQKILDHAWLLELGIILCEPGTHLQGMAGAGLWSDESWIAVPYDDIRIAPEQRTEKERDAA